MNHQEYLIRHGLLGDIGRFRAAGPLELSRGRRVVVRGPRGTEIGEVVRAAAAGGPGHGGDLVRAAAADDERRQGQLDERARALIRQGGALAESLGLTVEFLDAEVLLDGQHAALSYVSPARTDLAQLRRQVEQETGLFVALLDLTRPEPEPEPAGGCGDCGSGGGCAEGGCGSGGGCATGCGTERPEEIQAYFADLRRQAERRVSLL